ncbi:MAG: hypothetical protein V3S71_06290 [Acidobacteriota bacterium]
MRSEPKGMRAEAKTLKRLGFRPTKASGAIAEKGDGRLDDWYLEIKTTEKDSRAIKLDELRKAAREARQEGLIPAFSVVFVSGNGDPRHDGGWVLISEHCFRDYKWLVEENEPKEGTE